MADQPALETTEEPKPARRSLNLPDEVNKVAEVRAKAVRRSFNNYVEWLIAKDCGLVPEESLIPATLRDNPDGSFTARV